MSAGKIIQSFNLNKSISRLPVFVYKICIKNHPRKACGLRHLAVYLMIKEHAEKSLKEATEWMIVWAKLYTDISVRREQVIADALEKEAVNDIVADTTDTVIVSVCWHV